VALLAQAMLGAGAYAVKLPGFLPFARRDEARAAA